MNPSDPFVPQPGDWEAALEVIQASEARHDRGVFLRRWAGWGGLVLLLGAVIWMGARGEGDVAPMVESREAAAPATPLQGDGSPRANAGTDVDAGTAAASNGAEPAARAPQPADPPRLRAASVQPQRLPASVPASADQQEGWQADERRALDAPALLRSLGFAAFAGADLAAPLPRVKAASEPLATARNNAAGFLARESSAWAAGLTLSWSTDWRIPSVRVGGVWDQRARQWAALPERDGLGHARAAKAMASDAAVWALLATDWDRHLRGRWSLSASLEGQILLARELAPSTVLPSESLAPSAPAVWGALEEESRIRLRWSVGTTWSVTERQALRFDVGGYWAPQSELPHLAFTHGSPLPVGEFRATWLVR